jgi:tryptophan synthase alpha chain
MNVLQQAFSNQKAFIGYITAGHGGIAYTEQAACALVEGGVDILEIGVPFSDPIADGPVIQAAMQEALVASVDMHTVFHAIRKIKQQTHVPIVLFTYYNPLIAMGLDEGLSSAAKAGVDGVLVVDLPIEASKTYFEICKTHQLEPIGLISPSTDEHKVRAINKHCNAFLYYVCRNGITGIKDTLPSDYIEKIKSIRMLSDNPVVSGFGIGSSALAAEALRHADGFVVGSAFVRAISNGASPADLKNLATDIDPR